MSRDSTVLHLGWAIRNHHHVLNATAQPCPRSNPPTCSAGTQIVSEFLAKRTAPLDVERLIDGFVRDLHGGILGILLAEPRSYLLGRPPRLQLLLHRLTEGGAAG